MQARALFFWVLGRTRNETLKTLCKGKEEKRARQGKVCHWIAPANGPGDQKEKKKVKGVGGEARMTNDTGIHRQ